jgi:hypothetical protein
MKARLKELTLSTKDRMREVYSFETWMVASLSSDKKKSVIEHEEPAVACKWWERKMGLLI